MTFEFIVALGICLLGTLAASGQTSEGPDVVPGKSVGGIALGASVDSFEKKFPKKPNTDEDLPMNDCGIGGYHWVDVDRGYTGLYVYIKGDEIVQFSVKTPRFYFPNGIKTSATKAELRRLYPHGPTNLFTAVAQSWEEGTLSTGLMRRLV